MSFHAFQHDTGYLRRTSLIAFNSIGIFLHIYRHFLGLPSHRSDVGLPESWNRIESWLTFKGPIIVVPEDSGSDFVPKWPDIPVLKSYKGVASPSFWDNFPHKPMPKKPETSIDHEKLDALVKF